MKSVLLRSAKRGFEDNWDDLLSEGCNYGCEF